MEPDAPTATFFEFIAPVRVEGETDAQTIFTWMVANRYLWMLDGGWADRVEDLVGTARLIRLVGCRMRFRRKSPEHEALRLPAEESARVYAYLRLARFLEMHIVLDDVFNASRETPAPHPPVSVDVEVVIHRRGPKDRQKGLRTRGRGDAARGVSCHTDQLEEVMTPPAERTPARPIESSYASAPSRT